MASPVSKVPSSNSMQHPSKSVTEGAVEELPSRPRGLRRDMDVAAQFLANLDPAIAAAPIDPKEARKVLWKIDLCILPMIMCSCILSAVDKTIISNAALYGLKTDTDLVGDDFSWVGSIFFFGYLVAEMPLLYLVQRLPVAKFFSVTVLGWAIMMFCIAGTSNFAGLATVRFIMGAMESIVFPTCGILTVMWYSTKEQPIRVAIWYNTLSSVFTGTISYGIGHTHTSIAQWRLLFLVLGGFSVLFAVWLWIFLPDSPVKCWYMTDREKYICLIRVQGNNTGMEEKKIKWYQVRECLLEPKTWLIVIFSCAQNTVNGGLSTFSAFIVSGFGFDNLQTVLIGIPTGVIATIWQILLAYPTSRFKGYRCFIIVLANLIPLTSAIILWKIPRTNTSGLLGAYYAFYTYWVPIVLATSLPMANTSGHSKKITMNALMYIGYCVGNIFGPQVFNSRNAPTYTNSYAGLLACVIVATASIALYGFLLWRENKRRDNEALSADMDVVADEAFSDLTDREKKAFRYTY